MTMFAGVVALDGRSDIVEAVSADIRTTLSRYPGDEPKQFVGKAHFLCYLDIGAVRGRGDLVDENGSVTLLCGDPHLDGLEAPDRTTDLSVLHSAVLKGDDAPLRTARGSYCLAQFDNLSGRLRLLTDHLGVRPIYWAVHDGYLFFATALRVLESIRALPRTLDIRGVGEITAFGYPLAERSPYEQVKTLPPAGLLEMREPGEVIRRVYWDWNQLNDAGLRGEDLSRALYLELERSVRLRLRGGKDALALFSGGLDSRCVVALLRAAEAELHTINFAPRGSLDLEVGRTAAQQLGTNHFEYSSGLEGGYARLALAHRAWMDQVPRDKLPACPRAAWTGGGGSVGMGHVYLTPRIIGLMTSGQIDEAVDEYLRSQNIGISTRLFRARYRTEIQSLCHRGVLEELHAWKSFDEGRRFHMFLMFNDQRRHEVPLYEDIDLRRVEFISPFFDAAFVKLVLSAPVEPFLRHRLYYDWLKEFPFALDSFPWQAYPGHLPCPLPVPAGLRNQWEGRDSNDGRRELQRYRADLARGRFPRSMMRRSIAMTAWWLTRMRIRDASWMLKNVSTCAAYWAKSTRPL